MKILRNLSKFYAIFALQTGKVAPLLDSMFTVKINHSPFLGSTLMRFEMLILHNLFYLPFTTLTNILQVGDFATGWNRHIFMPLIFGQFMLYFGQDKINSIIRSFALASWPCQHHINIDIDTKCTCFMGVSAPMTMSRSTEGELNLADCFRSRSESRDLKTLPLNVIVACFWTCNNHFTWSSDSLP